MFDTCTAANRIIDQPLLTTFRRDYIKGAGEVVGSRTPPTYVYTRVRRASYKYVGCTHAAALTKAKELNLLYNRYVPENWKRTNDETWSIDRMTFKQCADVKIVLEHDIAYTVEVSLDEELLYRMPNIRDAPYKWAAFESNPDIATNKFSNLSGETTDFDYDGILPSS